VQSYVTDINNLGENSGFTSDEGTLFPLLILTPITSDPNTVFEEVE
jgi:hypothetical protein